MKEMEYPSLIAVAASEPFSTLLQSVGIIASLAIAGRSLPVASASLKENSQSTKADTLLHINSEHNRLLKEFTENPDLERVLEKSVDLRAHPLTRAEHRFVRSIILHTNVTFKANRLESLHSPEKLALDVCETFTLPIPAFRAHAHAQWKYLDKDFHRPWIHTLPPFS
jgi:hypothetical protein